MTFASLSKDGLTTRSTDCTDKRTCSDGKSYPASVERKQRAPTAPSFPIRIVRPAAALADQFQPAHPQRDGRRRRTSYGSDPRRSATPISKGIWLPLSRVAYMRTSVFPRVVITRPTIAPKKSSTTKINPVRAKVGNRRRIGGVAPAIRRSIAVAPLHSKMMTEPYNACVVAFLHPTKGPVTARSVMKPDYQFGVGVFGESKRAF